MLPGLSDAKGPTLLQLNREPSKMPEPPDPTTPMSTSFDLHPWPHQAPGRLVLGLKSLASSILLPM